jgi:hypothetical protein
MTLLAVWLASCSFELPELLQPDAANLGGASSGGTSGDGGAGAIGGNAGGSGGGIAGDSSAGTGGGVACTPDQVPSCVSDISAKPLSWNITATGEVRVRVAAKDGLFAVAVVDGAKQLRVQIFDRTGVARGALPAYLSTWPVGDDGSVTRETVAAHANAFAHVGNCEIVRVNRCGNELDRVAFDCTNTDAAVLVGLTAGFSLVERATTDLRVSFLPDGPSAALAPQLVGKIACCSNRAYGAGAVGDALHLAWFNDNATEKVRARIWPNPDTVLATGDDPRWAGVHAGTRLVVSLQSVLMLNAAGSITDSFPISPHVEALGTHCSFTQSPNRLYRACTNIATHELSVIDLGTKTETVLDQTVIDGTAVAWDGQGLVNVWWDTFGNRVMFRYYCGDP